MPIFRGMMTTLYCDLQKNITIQDVKHCLTNYYSKSNFVHLNNDNNRVDFFKVQNTNNSYIKFFNHYNTSKIIIVSLIDRVRALDNQSIRQDVLLKTLVGVPNLIDLEKIAKAERDDQRKD